MSDDDQKRTINGEEAPKDGLEDLLRTLHNQIKTSDWLEKNTATLMEKENPDLIRAWKEATDVQPQPNNSNSNL